MKWQHTTSKAKSMQPILASSMACHFNRQNAFEWYGEVQQISNLSSERLTRIETS